MPAEFRIVDITEWDVVDSEVLGRNPKLWVQEPGGGSDRERNWLYKPVVRPASTGHRQGEDWAEKIVSELGALIGVSCARVELAFRDGERGSISRNVVPFGYNRVLGSVLLGTVVPGYVGAVPDARGRERPVRGRPGHSPQNIFEALIGCDPPAEADAATAIEAFAGYLVLDAWVANQDRHDQNWAVLRPATGPGRLRLAPSYDHASSIGFSLTDEARLKHLRPGGMDAFARRGRANRFEHDPDAPAGAVMTLVELAHLALSLVGEGMEATLLRRLRDVQRSQVEGVVAMVPGLSETTARFILELLDVNRRRLLREC